MKEELTCSDNGQILSLLIESEEKVGYNFEIMIRDKNDEKKEYKFQDSKIEKDYQIFDFNINEQIIADDIFVQLNDEIIYKIEDYKIEIYPGKFIEIDRTIVPMDKTQSIVLTYSRELERNEFENVTFYKDENNQETIMYPKTNKTFLICSINFEYTNLEQGEYKILYSHKCNKETDSKFSVFFGNLDVHKITPDCYDVNTEIEITYEIILLGAIEGTKILLINEENEKLDDEPYTLIKLKEEFHYEFKIPKREKKPNLGKYFINIIKDDITEKSSKSIIVYENEVQLSKESMFLIYKKVLENPLLITLKEEIVPEQIISVYYYNTHLNFEIENNKIIKINTEELIKEMEYEKNYTLTINLINNKNIKYIIEYNSFNLINNKAFYDITNSHKINLPIQINIKSPDKYYQHFYISENGLNRQQLNCVQKENNNLYNIECMYDIEPNTNKTYFIEVKDGEDYYSKKNISLSLFTITEGYCLTETTKNILIKGFYFDSDIAIFAYSTSKNYELIKKGESTFTNKENFTEGEYKLKVTINDKDETYEIINSNIKIIKKYTVKDYITTIEKIQPTYSVEFEDQLEIEISQLIFKKKKDISYIIYSQSCTLNNENKKQLTCNFNFNGKDSGEYNLYYKDSCGFDVQITEDKIPILISERNTKYKLIEIKPESISLPMTSPQILNLTFNEKFSESEYITNIRFINDEIGELEYSFNVTYSEKIVTVENLLIKDPIEGLYKIKYIFNNGDFGLSEKEITFLSINFEFNRYHIILNTNPQVLFVNVLGNQKEKVVKLFIKDVNSQSVNYKEGNKISNFNYSFIIDTIGDKQLSYFRSDTGTVYNIIGRIIKVYNNSDDFISFEKVNQCFYKFYDSKDIIVKPKTNNFDSEELKNILQNLHVYILNKNIKKKFEFNKIDNSYTLPSKVIKDIDFAEYNITMIENEDFDNPIYYNKIIFSDLISYSYYVNDNIIFSNVICEFDNIYLIIKQNESEKKKLVCNLNEQIYKCEYPFTNETLSKNQDYIINQDNNKLKETNIIPSLSFSEFSIKFDGNKVGEKNKILLIPTFFNMNYLETITIKESNENIMIFKKENKEETFENTFIIENNQAVFYLKIESDILYKIIELKRIQFDSDLSIESIKRNVDILINENPEEEIKINNITGEIYEYSINQKLTIEFNKKIGPEEISNLIINNITNSKQKIFPDPQCIKFQSYYLKCTFNLSLIISGEYYLKYFNYKSNEYSTNITIKVNKEIIKQCGKGYILIEKKCILPDFSNDIENNKCKDNYCGNNGTCVENGLIPNCECKSSYSGLFCDIEEEQIEDHFKNLYNIFKNSSINELEENPILIKEINYIINNPEKISDNLKNEINDIINEKLSNIKEDTLINSQNYYLLINLFMTVALKTNQKVSVTKRILKEEDNPLLKIISLSKNIQNFNFINDFSPDSIKYLSTDSSMINYIFFTNHESSLKQLNQLSQKIKDLSTININNCSSSKFTSSKKAEVLISQIIFSKDISSYLSSSSNKKYISELITISAFPYEENKINLNNNIISQCKNLFIKMKLYGDINLNLLNKYSQCSQNGINIYDINDPAFNDQCFFCENGIDYDLPIIYNRENIYQKNKFSKSSNSISCNFNNVDSKNNKMIIFSCPSITNKISNDGFSYEVKQSNEEFKNKDNYYKNTKIPFKCPTYITKLHKNYAFWFYLIMLLLLIGVYILFYYINHNLLAIKNDKLGLEIKQSFELQDKSKKIKEIKEKYDTDSNSSNSSNTNSNVPEDEEKKSFLVYLIRNLIELHPLISIFLPSLIGNQMIKCLIFLFSIITTFGFNSLYFTQKMLEKRIEDESRNKFFYPLKSSFHRIFFSIISMMLLNAIARLICIVTKEKWNELDDLIRGSKDDEAKLNEADHFENDMKIRRLISIIFIFVVTIFFFYYCVIFFSIYKKAQIDWFNSGIWSMIFNWVLFSNLYITLITYFQTDGLNDVSYYMKRTFPF